VFPPPTDDDLLQGIQDVIQADLRPLSEIHRREVYQDLAADEAGAGMC